MTVALYCGSSVPNIFATAIIWMPFYVELAPIKRPDFRLRPAA
jgi:hypothetical protein